LDIFRIGFTFLVNEDGEDESEFHEGDHIHELEDCIFLGGYDAPNAMVEAMNCLDEMYNNYKINSVNLIADNILNWPDVEDEDDEHWTGDCDCPYEEFKKAVLDKRMKFDCSCGNKIEVCDNGWESIKCLSCNTWINRSEVTRDPTSGKLIYTKNPESSEKDLDEKIPD
jgi:hypothetical protein